MATFVLRAALRPPSLHLCQSLPIHSKPISFQKPQIPLFLRPANYSATLQDFQKWHLWAKTMATSVGSKFLALDNGPDSTLLHRELNWLIQDSLDEEELSQLTTLSSVAPASASSSASLKKVVKLRTCLDDLYRLWKERIEDRKPFQYLVGCEHWRDLILSVEEGVLIPRPETELIVDFVENVLAESDGDDFKEGLWADLGTGSGALAIAIGRILGCNGRVIATDLSPVPVAVAEYNVKRYSLQEKVEVKQGSWFEPLKEIEGKLAGIVSNPPYIPSENIAGLQAEVSKHEPILALDGGTNGMDDLLHLCNGAAYMLRPGGFFAFETNGEQQSKFLSDYLESELEGTLVDVKIESDLFGIPRFVKGFKAR